jgi:hypothetical protein
MLGKDGAPSVEGEGVMMKPHTFTTSAPYSWRKLLFYNQ